MGLEMRKVQELKPSLILPDDSYHPVSLACRKFPSIRPRRRWDAIVGERTLGEDSPIPVFQPTRNLLGYQAAGNLDVVARGSE